MPLPGIENNASRRHYERAYLQFEIIDTQHKENIMNVPDDLIFTDQHEWLRLDGETATVGVSDFAQQHLGDLTYMELPQVGQGFAKGDEVVVIESCKAAASVYAPTQCEIIEINESLEDQPGLVNSDPYSKGWVFKIKITAPPQLEGLMNPTAYEAFLESQD